MYISQKRLEYLLSKAIAAIDIAEGVLDYCGGDAWEMECTGGDRRQFSDLATEVRAAAKEYGIVANSQTTGAGQNLED